MAFRRYPHVGPRLMECAERLGDERARRILFEGVRDAEDARALCRFLGNALALMRADRESGRADDGDIIADIHHEISLHLADRGFEAEWDRFIDGL